MFRITSKQIKITIDVLSLLTVLQILLFTYHTWQRCNSGREKVRIQAVPVIEILSPQ